MNDDLCTDHPCIWCGALLLLCGVSERCCPECDHPYSLRQMVEAIEAERLAKATATA